MTGAPPVRLVGSRNGAWDVGVAYLLLPVSSGSASLAAPYLGFPPLPPHTVRAVLPHTAFRHPSAGGIQGKVGMLKVGCFGTPTIRELVQHHFDDFHIRVVNPGRPLSSR